MLAVCFPKALALGAPINSLKKQTKKKTQHDHTIIFRNISVFSDKY